MNHTQSASDIDLENLEVPVGPEVPVDPEGQVGPEGLYEEEEESIMPDRLVINAELVYYESKYRINISKCHIIGVMFGSRVYIGIPRSHSWSGRTNRTIQELSAETGDILFPFYSIPVGGIEFSQAYPPYFIQDMFDDHQLNHWWIGWNYPVCDKIRYPIYIKDTSMPFCPVALFDEVRDADIIAQIRSELVYICDFASEKPPVSCPMVPMSRDDGAVLIKSK